jgi:outer membrane protein TolC
MARVLRFFLLALSAPVAAIISSQAWAAEPLTLGDAIARALAYAPANQLAVAQRDLGTAKVEEARAPLMPAIVGNGEYLQAPGYDQVITNRGMTLAQLGLNYTVFDGGLRQAQLRAARYAQQAAALGIDAARGQIIFDTTAAYFELWRQRAIAAELQRGVARLSNYVTTMRNLQRTGRAIANDVLSIESARNATELSLAAANEAAAHAAIVLGSLINQPHPETLELAEIPALPLEPNGDITRSPAFVAAERQIAAADAGIRAAQAERSPTIKLALTSGWEGIDPPKTFGHHLGASYDGAVSVPIFEGGLVRAHVDAAKATRNAAVAQLRQIEINLRRDLAAALSSFESARQQLAILHRSQTVADDAFALNWTRFLGGGNVTLLEVISSFQAAQNLRIARFDNEFMARQAVAQANLILGNGL